MTKKMEKLVKKFEKKIDTVKWEYDNGFIDFEKLQKRTNKEVHDFNEMRYTMYRYDLISENDLTETTHIASDYNDKIFNEILHIN